MCLILFLSSMFINQLFVDKTDDNYTTSYVYDNSVSSIVMDTKTKRVLYENNINKRMLPASTTKILTCITALELYELDDFVVVTKEMISVEGSRIYLEVGDVISVQDLLYGLMLCSGNDAANALAYHYSGKCEDFIFRMNELAKKIGMKSSTFENPHGLDSSTKNLTTTYDMALLMSYAIQNDTFRKINKTVSYNPKIISSRRLYFTNKHKLIKSNSEVTGGKTGFTKDARRTLVTTFKKDDFEIVVVTFNCSDDWNIHTKLANYTFEKYSLQKIVSKFDIMINNNNSNNYFIDSNLLYFPKTKDEKVEVNFFENDNLVLNYYINNQKVGYVEFRSKTDE